MGSAVASRRAKIRVAIVDDHRLVLEGLESKLGERAHGLSVCIAEIRWVDAIAHPDFPVDVVVLDLHLEDSIPIGTKIRALASMGIPAVVVSRHADATSVSAALRAGAAGFVPKTESTAELIAAIRSAVANNDSTPAPMPPVAVDAVADSPDPRLGKQELRALVLYAGGRSIREVAAEMATTEETVKSYIKRGRSKYRRVGIDVGTRILLRQHALREGWIAPE
jgi:two-component system, NarL family, uhpT operon response regulator UhpA